MNKLILAIGLCVSLSANAWDVAGPDSIIIKEDLKTGEQVVSTLGELELDTEITNPVLFNWCVMKGNFSAGVINDRDIIPKETMLGELEEIVKAKIAHFQWLEVQRIVNEYTSKNTNGEWTLKATDENLERTAISEYQHCIVNGF